MYNFWIALSNLEVSDNGMLDNFQNKLFRCKFQSRMQKSITSSVVGKFLYIVNNKFKKKNQIKKMYVSKIVQLSGDKFNFVL